MATPAISETVMIIETAAALVRLRNCVSTDSLTPATLKHVHDFLTKLDRNELGGYLGLDE